MVCEDAEMMRRFPREHAVCYDKSMIVTLSDRRFRQNGFGKTLALWAVADIRGWLGKGIHTRKYKKVKE